MTIDLLLANIDPIRAVLFGDIDGGIIADYAFVKYIYQPLNLHVYSLTLEDLPKCHNALKNLHYVAFGD